MADRITRDMVNNDLTDLQGVAQQFGISDLNNISEVDRQRAIKEIQTALKKQGLSSVLFHPVPFAFMKMIIEVIFYIYSTFGTLLSSCFYNK